MMRNMSSKSVERNRRAKLSSRYVVARRLCLTFLLDALVLTVLACNNGVRPTATITAADTADQVLVDMTHYVTHDGVVRARVEADTAFFYQPVQRAEMRTVRITFYDPDGRATSTMSAREGTYHWASGDMEGRGRVVVIGASDGRTLRSEVMRYRRDANEVASDLPFVFDAPGRHVEGEGFTSDPDFRNVVAKRPRGTGGQFTLPNQ